MISQRATVRYIRVALLAEGVDRNLLCSCLLLALPLSPSSRRAWIEISEAPICWHIASSPSSRRAWIEILSKTVKLRCWKVALLAEGVDRNIDAAIKEMDEVAVALLAEGVDRNLVVVRFSRLCYCRPPRGGRG